MENKTQKQRSKQAFQRPKTPKAINVLTPRKKESRPNSKQ